MISNLFFSRKEGVRGVVGKVGVWWGRWVCGGEGGCVVGKVG